MSLRSSVMSPRACSDVVHRTDGLFRHGFVVLAVESRNAEIHDLDGAVAEQHNIAGLYVAVYYPAVVRVLKRFKYLHGEMHRVAPFEHALLLDVVGERDAVDILHDDKLHLVGEAYVVNFHDVRVREKRDRLRFVPEAAQELIAARKLGFKYLYSNNAVLNNVAGAVDIRHSSDADKLQQLISAIKLLSDITVHICSAISPYIMFKAPAPYGSGGR